MPCADVYMLQGGTKLLAAHLRGTLLFCVSIISLAFTATGFLTPALPLLLPRPPADCMRAPCTAASKLMDALALAAALPRAAVEDTGLLKPLIETLRGKPMVLMRVCSLSRAVVASSSTLVCLQWSTWEVLLSLRTHMEYIQCSAVN